MKTPARCIGLIRHSVTLWNEAKKIQGQHDTPLTARGVAMAKKWGQTLAHGKKWDAIVTSDLGRAVETANLINTTLALPCRPDRRLREQDWGRWTGMTVAEIKANEKAALKREVEKGWDFHPPGGESRQQVLDRALAAIRDAAVRNPGNNLLVVCHEGVIKSIIYHLAGRRYLPTERKLLLPYHQHLLMVREGTLTLEAVNHLALSVE